MALYPTILVAINPTDLHAHQLVTKAAVIAEQNHAELHLAYVEKNILNKHFIYRDESLFNFHSGKELERIEQLKELSSTSPYPITNIHIAAGDLVKHLADLANEVQAKLIIIGSKDKLTNVFGGLEASLASCLDCDILHIKCYE